MNATATTINRAELIARRKTLTDLERDLTSEECLEVSEINAALGLEDSAELWVVFSQIADVRARLSPKPPANRNEEGMAAWRIKFRESRARHVELQAELMALQAQVDKLMVGMNNRHWEASAGQAA